MTYFSVMKISLYLFISYKNVFNEQSNNNFTYIVYFCLFNFRFKTIVSLPSEIQKEYPTLKIETWEYGTVAEILHIGPYTKEQPTVQRLTDFIDVL